MRTHGLTFVLLIAIAACGGPAPEDKGDGVVQIAATLHPIASIARSIGGDDVVVRTLLPPGAHPDTYEATPQMARSLAGADLVVRVGGTADEWIGAPATEILVLTRGMRLVGSDGAAGATGNPHVWLDPILVRDSLLPRLTGALIGIVPASAGEIRRRAAAYADSLTALDGEIRQLLEGADNRRFAAAHPAWVYFADRYGLEEVGSLHPSPGRALGGRELAMLVDDARAAAVAAVIAEPQLGRAGTGALADELDVRIEVADPIGGPGLAGREDYLALMRFNARAFARALGVPAAESGAGDGVAP